MATTKVELYNGATLVATKTSAPFTSIDWTPVTTGAATLTAKRYEDGVLVATSSVKNYTVNAAAGQTFVLDDYPGAKSAYSFRKLRTAYTGAAIRVEKTGAVQSDIGFVDGYLDTAALLAFAGAGSARVRTIYDQSGNGNDWVQATFSNQPYIVTNGNLDTQSGNVRINTSSTETLQASFATANAISTDFSVLGSLATGFASVGVNADASKYFGLYNNGSTATALSSGVGTPSYYVNGALFTGTTRADLHTALSPTMKVIATTNLDLTTFTGLGFDHVNIAPVTAPQHFAEKIIYDSDQSANRAAIENNINAFYTVY